MSQVPEPTSSRGKLLQIIERFLIQNPEITDSNFGWRAIKDAKLVNRLRNGGDMSTAKMDSILAFITTYKKDENDTETCK